MLTCGPVRFMVGSVDEASIYRAFGVGVARRRRELHLTQQQVSNAIGTSRATVANVEKGKHKLPLHQVYRLTLALGLRDVATLLPPLPAGAAEEFSADAGDFPVDISGPDGGVSDAARRQIARIWEEIGVNGS